MRLKLLIWFLAAAAVLTLPICAYYYFSALGESGVLGIEDAIMIPIFGFFLAALLAAPILALITFVGTKRLNPEMNLFVWKSDRPVRSILATLIFGAVALIAVFSAVEPFWRNLPTYEHYWQPMNLAWFLWALSMRSAFIDKQPLIESSSADQIEAASVQ